MDQYQITALFQDGKSRLYQLNNDAKVSDLMHVIEKDDEVKIPKNRSLNILYLGRFLDPSTQINKIEQSTQFTVNCFFRANKNSTNNDESVPLESELRGFDRLSRMGYNPGQIRDFRENFHRFNSSLNLSENARIDLEEEWFPALFSGDEVPQFFTPINQNQNQNQNQEDETEGINQNNDFDMSPDSEVPFAQTPTDTADSNPSWAPFFLGVVFGFVFRLNWYIFIPLMHPDRSILIGYLFGCGLFYLFVELSKK